MKDDAEGLALPNNQNPRPFAKPYYGNLYNPHACNEEAKMTNAAKVMSNVLEAK